jgi:hypothetical protein
MEGIKTDNLTEEQKFELAAQTNALGEALAENAALRSRFEAMEQKHFKAPCKRKAITNRNNTHIIYGWIRM